LTTYRQSSLSRVSNKKHQVAFVSEISETTIYCRLYYIATSNSVIMKTAIPCSFPGWWLPE